MGDDSTTWADLSKALRFSRQAVAEWRKLPGAPQTPDVTAWKKFIADNELGIVGNRVSKDREGLLTRKLAAEVRLAELKAAKEERTVIDRDAVDAMLLRLGSLQKTVLYQKLEKEFPAKAAAHGAQVEAMQRLGREAADALCEIFTGEMDKWTEAQ